MNELRALSFKKGVATVGFDRLTSPDLAENYNVFQLDSSIQLRHRFKRSFDWQI